MKQQAKTKAKTMFTAWPKIRPRA